MGNPDSNTKQSAASSTLECIVFLVLVVVLMLPLVYVANNDQIHDDDPHPLDVVFQDQDHSKILAALSSKKQNLIVIEGEEDSGVLTFVKHYASANKDRTVLLRQYSDDPLQTAYSIFRFARSLVEGHLDLEGEDNSPKTWVLIGFQVQVPKEDIREIQVQGPKDKIVVVTSHNLKMKGAKTYNFTPITIEQLQATMQNVFSMDEQTSTILTQHYGTVPQIFNNLDIAAYSPQALLGDDYEAIGEISDEEKQILENLCEKGSIKGKKLSAALQDLGVILLDGKYYWANSNTRLNYALQTNSQCLLTQATQEQLIEFNEFTDLDEQQNDEDDQNEEAVAQDDNDEAQKAIKQEQNNNQQQEQDQDNVAPVESDNIKSKKSKKQKKSKKSKKSKKAQQDNEDEKEEEKEDQKEEEPAKEDDEDDKPKKKSKKSKKNKKVKEQIVEEPQEVEEQPIEEEPVVQQPVVEEPVVQQPVVQQPVVEEPVVEEPEEAVVPQQDQNDGNQVEEEEQQKEEEKKEEKEEKKKEKKKGKKNKKDEEKKQKKGKKSKKQK